MGVFQEEILRAHVLRLMLNQRSAAAISHSVCNEHDLLHDNINVQIESNLQLIFAAESIFIELVTMRVTMVTV